MLDSRNLAHVFSCISVVDNLLDLKLGTEIQVGVFLLGGWTDLFVDQVAWRQVHTRMVGMGGQAPRGTEGQDVDRQKQSHGRTLNEGRESEIRKNLCDEKLGREKLKFGKNQ